MKFISELRRRSTLTFRRVNVSKESHLSGSSDSFKSHPHVFAGASTPELSGSKESSVDTTPPSSTGTSPPPSEFVMVPPETSESQISELPSPALDCAQSEVSSSQGLAAVIDNLGQGQPVSNQVVLLQGHIPSPNKLDGTLHLHNLRGQIPSTSWPVSQSKFKALAYLQCGVNQFSLEFVPAGSRSKYNSSFLIRYHPMTSCAPIKLVILCAKDSRYLNDEMQSGTTELSIAAAKYRMSAYLWQSFISEQMKARENQRRTFQLENDWSESTLYSEDFHSGEMRNQAPVHVVSLDRTTEELKGLDSTDFAAIAEAALMKRFTIPRTQRIDFACMFLDSEGNPGRNLEYGGLGIAQPDRIGLAIYGAQSLSSYPSSIDRVTASFSDEKQTPGVPEPTRWKSATKSIGTHLKLVGKMLGLPEQEYGMMSEESCRIGSMFSLYAAQHIFEPRLHPLDVVRLRHNPAIQSPFAPIERQKSNCSPCFWGQSDSSVFISSRIGLLAIEVYTSGDTVCRNWISLLDKRGQPRFTYLLSLNEVLKLSSPKSNRYSTYQARHGPYSMHILTADGKSTPIVDFEAFAKRLAANTSQNSKTPMFKSQTVGIAEDGAGTQNVMFPSGTRMLSLTVFHTPGLSISGVEFNFEEQKVLFGTRSGEAHKEWKLHATSGEALMGVELCVKQSLKGLRLFTSSGRWSPWFGDATAGTEYKLVPPPTYRIVGIAGHVGASISSLQFIVAR